MKCKVTALLAVMLAVSIGTTAWANDELIAQQIIQRLQLQKQQSQLEGFNIGVQVDQGTVTVMGTVQEPDHAVLALDIVRRVPGVKLVVNDLFVQKAGQTGNAVQQASATEATKSLIISAPNALTPATSAPSLQPPSINGNVAGFPNTPAAALPQTAAPAAAPAPPLTQPAPPQTQAGQTVALQPQPQQPQPQQPQPQQPQPQQPQPQQLQLQQLPQPRPQAPAPAATATPETIAQAAPAAEPQQLQQIATPQSLNPRSASKGQMPLAFARVGGTRAGARPVNYHGNPGYTVSHGGESHYGGEYYGDGVEYGGTSYGGGGYGGEPVPMSAAGMGMGGAGGYSHGSYDNPQMPGYAWPSYASYPNYAAVTYPHQYSPTAWPYIGPFYPYPQVPLGWRKVTLEWDDGWWFLDFKSK